MYSYRKITLSGSCTICIGYGEVLTRGTPGSRHSLVGSMWFHTSLKALRPSGVNGSGSTAAAVFCTSRLFQTPERSALPSAVRGTGVPSGAVGVGTPRARARTSVATSNHRATASAVRDNAGTRMLMTVLPLGDLPVGAARVGLGGRARQHDTAVGEPPRAGVAGVGAVPRAPALDGDVLAEREGI